VLFRSLAIAPDGALVVAWVDQRDALARAKLPEDQRPKDDRWIRSDDPRVEVRLARSIDGGASFTSSVSIATGASERSRISLAIGADGQPSATYHHPELIVAAPLLHGDLLIAGGAKGTLIAFRRTP